MSTLKQKEPLFQKPLVTCILVSPTPSHQLYLPLFSYGEVPIHATEGASSTALNSTYWDHSRVT